MLIRIFAHCGDLRGDQLVQIGAKPLIAREKILPAAKGKQTFLEFGR
jgi:hypothetical protein